jgi:hypothetical protein
LIDTAQFIAGESETASASGVDRWLADLVIDLVGSEAEARLIDPDCDPQDVSCEHEIPSCEDDPTLCKNPPVIECDHLTKIDDTYIFVPCHPKDNGDRPFRNPHDPNAKYVRAVTTGSSTA